jgi:hypothetical protein
MLDPEEKTVLVHFNERVRPVKFNGGKDDLAASVCAAFADVFEVQSRSILLQVAHYVYTCNSVLSSNTDVDYSTIYIS